LSRGETLAAEVQAWVDANWSESLTVREWWRRLAGAGYAYPTWPAGVGGSGATTQEARIVTGILARNRVVAPPTGHLAAALAAPTLLEHGTPEQIDRFVRAIALGEAAWCQLFSEPGSGSDLASVGTRAERDGDEWVINGQKVWNSAADSADFGMLLARTDPDRPKHRGMTYFVIDMYQPGVETRPLKTMSGQSSFCEVFLTDARVPADGIVGGLDDGWRVAQTTLFHERNSLSAGLAEGLSPARSGRAGDLDRTVGEVITHAREIAKQRKSPIRTSAVPSKVMIALARDHGLANDAVIRQELARYVTNVRVNGWTMGRIGAARGRLTGADASISKLSTSRICQDSRELSYRIVGPQAMLSGPESPMGGALQAVNLESPATRLGGGTDEIHLNLLGERGLGLPREPGDDRDIPYRELTVGTQR